MDDDNDDDDNNDPMMDEILQLGDGTLPSLSSMFTLAEMGGSKDMFIPNIKELKRSGAIPRFLGPELATYQCDKYCSDPNLQTNHACIMTY